VAAFALTGALAGQASASIASLSGNWVNVAPGGDIPSMQITPAGGTHVHLHVWGACSPTPCDWGQTNGTTYALQVGGNPMVGAAAVTAFYQQGFARRLVVLREQGMFLHYEIFSAFEDGSGRNSYISSGTLRKH
jgi:hypothetical protein